MKLFRFKTGARGADAPTTPKCDYHECNESVCKRDEKLAPPALQFCAEHSKECDVLARSDNIAELVRFWINAKGGPELLARDIVQKSEK